MPDCFDPPQGVIFDDDNKRSIADHLREPKATTRATTDEASVASPDSKPDLEGEEPTFWDLDNLPRVSGKIPWQAYTIAVVEMGERFGYNGVAVIRESTSVFQC